ncbi:hypothetical protein COOONC_03738 [Cooperia oncophora]
MKMLQGIVKGGNLLFYFVIFRAPKYGCIPVERKLALQVIIRSHQLIHLQEAAPETTTTGNDHEETTSLKSHRKQDEHYNPRPRQNTHCKQNQQSEDREDIEITEPPKKEPPIARRNNNQQHRAKSPSAKASRDESDDNLQERPPRNPSLEFIHKLSDDCGRTSSDRSRKRMVQVRNCWITTSSKRCGNGKG